VVGQPSPTGIPWPNFPHCPPPHHQQIVAQPGDAAHDLRSIADQAGAAHRRGQPAILDQEGLLDLEVEIALGDVDRPAADHRDIEALGNHGDDVLRPILPGCQAGDAHARMRHMAVILAPAIAAGGDSEDARREPVIEIADQPPLLIQDRLARG